MRMLSRIAAFASLALGTIGVTGVTDAPTTSQARGAAPLGVGTLYVGDQPIGARRAPERTPAPRALVETIATDATYLSAIRGFRGYGSPQGGRHASWRIVKRGRSAAVAVLAVR
ncbi:hypothetical protein [Roseisolibacter agri]|uniref:Uncharacterized protein n=1 Tax=Roseisolibacter agri TaxID=2014610 RepID=A0AA37QFZ4_9BACT|nr:hypothetical protein [Roseisolibacter agri]GLC25073.1 hypothetical protein rosag_15860 [Roseisolibacter agri]